MHGAYCNKVFASFAFNTPIFLLTWLRMGYDPSGFACKGILISGQFFYSRRKVVFAIEHFVISDLDSGVAIRPKLLRLDIALTSL